MNDYQKKVAEHKEWLDSLKPGDEAAILGGGWRRRYEIATVLRRTKTQIIINSSSHHEARVRADTGILIGRRLGGIEKLTDQMREQIKAQSRRYRLAVLTEKVQSLTDAQVSAMLEAYDRVTETDKAA